jgi:surface protein
VRKNRAISFIVYTVLALQSVTPVVAVESVTAEGPLTSTQTTDSLSSSIAESNATTTDTTQSSDSIDTTESSDSIKGEVMNSEESQTTESSEIEDTKNTSVRSITTGVWGDVSWSYDDSTGILTFTSGGALATHESSPWNRKDSLRIPASAIKKIIFTESVNAPSNSIYLFNGINIKLSNVTSIEGIEQLNTSNVVYMGNMFRDMTSLTKLDLRSFDTSNVVDMNRMFNGTNSLSSLDVSNFDTSNVINMQSMFDGASSLTNLDVSNFDTEKVTNMSYMFMGTASLTSLDIANFKTANVSTMRYMFRGTNLTSLDLTNFDTTKVTNMSYMFMEASNLTDLDLRPFNTSSVTTMESMFYDMRNLTSLNIESFDLSNVTNKKLMFGLDSRLRFLTLGTAFSDVDNQTALPDIAENEQYTGYWQLENGGTVGRTNEFLRNYDGSVPGTYTWEQAQDPLNPDDSTQNDLVLTRVPSAFNFSSVLMSGEYQLSQNLSSDEGFSVKNNRLDRDWSIRATVQDNQMISESHILPLKQFTIDGIALVGTGNNGIVTKSEEQKTLENNVGTIQRAVNEVSVTFSDENHVLKVGSELHGTIDYQLYNTATVE